MSDRWWHGLWSRHSWYRRTRTEEDRVKQQAEARKAQLEKRLNMIERVMEKRRA